LPKVIVKEVIKDLIKGDASKQEVITLNDVIAQKGIQLSSQDTIISSLNLTISNYESIISIKQSQESQYVKLSEDLQKALKQEKRRSFIYKVGSGIGAVVTLILLAK
tara:strand:+ start:775 stop:1095 length:321 start_codon:yes stop_codon:yes gene_type:complete